MNYILDEVVKVKTYAYVFPLYVRFFELSKGLNYNGDFDYYLFIRFFFFF